MYNNTKFHYWENFSRRLCLPLGCTIFCMRINLILFDLIWCFYFQLFLLDCLVWFGSVGLGVCVCGCFSPFFYYCYFPFWSSVFISFLLQFIFHRLIFAYVRFSFGVCSSNGHIDSFYGLFVWFSLCSTIDSAMKPVMFLAEFFFCASFVSTRHRVKWNRERDIYKLTLLCYSFDIFIFIRFFTATHMFYVDGGYWLDVCIVCADCGLWIVYSRILGVLFYFEIISS